MEKKAIIFMDYNGTFDDVEEGKGAGLFYSLIKFFSHFDWNVEIAVITSALTQPMEYSIKEDLTNALFRFPSALRPQFKYLIEENCKHISHITFDGDFATYSFADRLYGASGTKKDGVEQFLKKYDKDFQFSTCVFVGDDEKVDAQMLNADVEGREKYMILAKSAMLKTDVCPNCVKYTLPKFTKGPFNFVEDFQSKVGAETPSSLLIKTTNGSSGVGRGFDALTILLKEKDRSK